MELGHAIISGGTDNHLVLLNLNPAGVDGSRVQQLLDEVCLICVGSALICLGMRTDVRQFVASLWCQHECVASSCRHHLYVIPSHAGVHFWGQSPA